VVSAALVECFRLVRIARSRFDMAGLLLLYCQGNEHVFLFWKLTLFPGCQAGWWGYPPGLVPIREELSGMGDNSAATRDQVFHILWITSGTRRAVADDQCHCAGAVMNRHHSALSRHDAGARRAYPAWWTPRDPGDRGNVASAGR